MSHDELRALLPRYAAGGLEAAEAERVRTHLAGGCTTCLDEVFALPVGLPRVPAIEDAVAPAPPPAAMRRGTPARFLLVAIVLLALACAGLAAWTVVEVREREAAARAEAARSAARLTELEAERAALTERAASATRARLEAEAEAARQAEAVRATAESSAELRHELEAALTRVETLSRGLRRRDREVESLLGGLDGERALHDLVATPGVEVLRLVPVAPFESGRGHALWHAGQESLIVYAFDLPELAGGGRYHVRVRLESGRVALSPPAVRGARGDFVQTVRVGVGGGRVRDVEVIAEASGLAVLAGRATPGG